MLLRMNVKGDQMHLHKGTQWRGRRNRAATSTAAAILVAVTVVFGLPFVSAQISDCSAFAPPAIIKGRKIFDSSSGSYIPIKGINYYPRPNSGLLSQTNSIDFFTEEYRAIWERDIANFQQLQVNVVRIYAVSPGQNHDGFMCALKAAGMYAVIGLAADCEDCAIGKDSAPACYSAALKERGQFIISEFARYHNVLAFSAGNEVSLTAASTESNGPCQKQFIRDMRAFVQSCNSTIRHIPIGLEIADEDRSAQALWYGCRSNTNDELENAEFIGINTYVHCDGALTSIEQLIGYEQLLTDFASYNLTVPVIISEFGCLNPSFPTIDGFEAQRNFLDVDAMFSQRYRKEFVGGIVFEYSTELINSLSPFPFVTYGAGNFGVGYFEPENCDDIDVPCIFVPFPQFSTLAAKYNAVDTSSEPDLSIYSFERKPPTCPTQFAPLSSFSWPSSTTGDLACPNVVYVQCLGVPTECSNLGIPVAPTGPTRAPTISTPTVSPTMGDAPERTKSPVARNSSAPTETPTGASQSTQTSEAPVLSVTERPTARLANMSTSVSPSQVPSLLTTSFQPFSANDTLILSTNRPTPFTVNVSPSSQPSNPAPAPSLSSCRGSSLQYAFLAALLPLLSATSMCV